MKACRSFVDRIIYRFRRGEIERERERGATDKREEEEKKKKGKEGRQAEEKEHGRRRLFISDLIPERRAASSLFIFSPARDRRQNEGERGTRLKIP